MAFEKASPEVVKALTAEAFVALVREQLKDVPVVRVTGSNKDGNAVKGGFVQLPDGGWLKVELATPVNPAKARPPEVRKSMTQAVTETQTAIADALRQVAGAVASLQADVNALKAGKNGQA